MFVFKTKGTLGRLDTFYIYHFYYNLKNPYLISPIHTYVLTCLPVKVLNWQIHLYKLISSVRPVSSLSPISKVLDRHVHITFYKFNYYTWHSMVFKLFYTAIDSDNLNGVILLDLRKVFDLIDHDILFHKLNCTSTLKSQSGGFLLLLKRFSSYLKLLSLFAATLFWIF